MTCCWIFICLVWIGLRNDSAGGVNLVPYGTEVGDILVPLGAVSGNESAYQQVSFPVAYLGRRFNEVFVYPDGYISFGAPARIHYAGLPWTFPLKHPKQTEDPALLITYYARTLISADDLGRVFYRRMDRYSQEGRDLLLSQNTLVRLYLIGYGDYSAHSVLVATWSDVTFPGYVCLTDSKNCPPRNTFQCVLLTDGTRTVVLLNYKQLSWLAGPQDGGSATSGSTQTHYPLAGFNSGQGRGWHALPLSASHDVTKLMTYDRGAEPGQFLYAVEGVVRAGGCSSNNSLVELRIHPSHGTFHGGNTVTLSGPCLTDKQALRCKFRDRVVDGRIINPMQLQCIVPFIGRLDWVDVSLSVDGGATFPWSVNYYLVKKTEVRLEKPESWHEIDPGELSISWNPASLDPSKTGRVNIQLYGFNVTQKYQYLRLHQLASDVPNSGKFTFKPSAVQCVDFLCADYLTGVIRVALAGPDHTHQPFAWSSSTSILWYSYLVNLRRDGEKWAHYKCDLWYRRQMADRKWLKSLPECPCLLRQALADFRFRSDPGCDMYGDTSCARHQRAKHCVLSEFVTAEGSGSQCCYGLDDLLMHAFDSKFGSFSQRVSPLGAKPYSVALLPNLGHTLQDIEPYNLCCRWSTMTCDRYLTVRPTPPCHNYRPNKLAFVYGDPHFLTFGGQRYTFNGRGEFTLMTSSEQGTVIQGRFSPPASETVKSVAATALTSVVVSADNSSTVELTVNPPEWGWARGVRVLVDGRGVDFQHWSTRQEHKGVIITDHPSQPGPPHSNYTVLLRSGLALRIHLTSSNFLHLVVSAPRTFRSATTGLLGGWGDIADMRTSDGDPVDPDTLTPELLHKQFGLSWLVSEQSSLFTYLHGDDYSTFSDSTFSPKYPPPRRKYTRKRRTSTNQRSSGDKTLSADVRTQDSSKDATYRTKRQLLRHERSRERRESLSRPARATEEEVENLCHTDAECRYDYDVTNDDKMAGETRVAGELARDMVLANKFELFCPSFHIPYAIKSTHNYSLHQTVEITGCDVMNGEYTLTGHVVYTCVPRGQAAVWEPAVDAQCYPFPVTAVALGTGGALLIVLLVAVIVGGYFMYPKFRALGEKKPWRDLTERELRLQRRRSARMSRFIMKNRGEGPPSDPPSPHQLGTWDRLRNSIRRKSSKPTARISPTHTTPLATVPEDKEIQADDLKMIAFHAKTENGFLTTPTPSRVLSLDDSTMYYDCSSNADTSFADCLSSYPESLVSDEYFESVAEDTADSSGSLGNDLSRSFERNLPSRSDQNFWPEAEEDPGSPERKLQYENVDEPANII